MDRFYEEKLERYFPELLNEITDYKEIGYAEAILYMEDGRVLRFDAISNFIKELPSRMEDMTDSEYKAELGLRIKRAMAFHQISQEELSYRTDISQPVISRYVTGHIHPSTRVIHKISRAIGCGVDDLIYDY